MISENLRNNIKDYSQKFQEAEPFRHVLIPEFFAPDTVQNLLKDFPQPREDEMRSEFGRKSRKYACHDVRNISPFYARLDDYIRSPEFIGTLERLTGIDGLIYDPEYHGAGTHENFSGQGMDAHVDFNLHRTTGLHRRINAIIYLNEEWEEEWGGCLELHSDPWNFRRNETKSFLPLLNHCVLFETNEYSWHGFEKVNPPEGRDLSRRSFTIYMYTKDRPKEEIAAKHGTIYVQKATPPHFQPGHTLTEQDIADLDFIFQHRNNYLKGMYDRDSKNQVQIEHLRKVLAEKPLPVAGFALQKGGATGTYPNNGAGRSMSITLEALRDLQAVEFRGTLPRALEANTVSVRTGSTTHELDLDQTAPAFKVPVKVKAGETVTLDLTFGETAPSHVETDKRPYAFIIDHILAHDKKPFGLP